MSKNRGKSKLSKTVLFNANKHVFNCEKSLGPLFYGPPSYMMALICVSSLLHLSFEDVPCNGDKGLHKKQHFKLSEIHFKASQDKWQGSKDHFLPKFTSSYIQLFHYYARSVNDTQHYTLM
jgi:hypothetical protein